MFSLYQYSCNINIKGKKRKENPLMKNGLDVTTGADLYLQHVFSSCYCYSSHNCSVSARLLGGAIFTPKRKTTCHVTNAAPCGTFT